MPGITSRLERLRAIPVEAIREYRQTKTSALIPADLQPYILQLDTVARMTHTHNFSFREAVDALMKEFPDLTPASARTIYYDWRSSPTASSARRARATTTRSRRPSTFRTSSTDGALPGRTSPPDPSPTIPSSARSCTATTGIFRPRWSSATT